MNLKNLMTCAMAGAALALASVSFGHDSPAKHGGVVRNVGDMQFELVAGDDGAIIHIEDHGKPVPTAAMSGKLTVLTGKETRETELVPAGGNRLQAKGVKLGSGAKAVAAIQRDGKTTSVRFALK